MTTATQLENDIDNARKDAITRINAIMLPGAQALCDARRSADDYWRTVEIEAHGCTLIWRSQGHRSVCGTSGPVEGRAATQIVAPDGVSPETLVRLTDLAIDTTARIIREQRARLAESQAMADALIAAFASVANSEVCS